jgi:NAD(P)-dependent dehydrogenase (short-subunit alcohol dehydrogenase family)
MRALFATGERLKVVKFDDSPLAVSLAGSALGRELAMVGPLTPDQIVYAGPSPLFVDAPEAASPDQLLESLTGAIAARATTDAAPPAIVIVHGLGIFAIADTAEQADAVLGVWLDAATVSVDAHRMGGARPLSEAERGFIDRREAEPYRKGVAAGASVAGRARGLVVVVTGAAQGFGHAIAADIAAQGGHVVLADINAELAKSQADALASEFGSGRAVGVALDVTDDASVAACFDEVVRRFGGLDLLVSNAGILRAGSVTGQRVEEFDAVTRVNYRGYFLCVRHAAPILARQHRARPEYWGDIIEINSKSGLAGSSRNSAYAGSKFGGIGLTQSFALELVGDGIKVNAICPGNFLDGPLWADPNNGLFVQYLREGKVPGATTVEEVRRVYEAKVPMGRGCTPADVLEALYYVVAQKYETGQAIPVTGGQVMLK